MERLEDLNLNGLKIYQDDSLYCFTSDAVLLSKFATVKKGDRVADFCSGSGIVGLHLYGLNPNVESVTLVEMQKSLFSLSLKSVEYNGLSEKFNLINCKVQELGNEYAGKFSLIVSNPPYMEVKSGFSGEDYNIAVCKSELTLTLKELIATASKCLKFGGRFAMVNRIERLTDSVCLLREAGIEPKRLQFVSGGNKAPYLFLIEGVKGGKNGIKVLKEATN